MTPELTASLLSNYKRAPVTFVSGKGAKLMDSKGNEYIDWIAGVAVASVGHGNEQVAEAIYEQAKKLVHVSNLYWTEPMVNLSNKLSEISGEPFRTFFCNSGAEANEAAIKLVRKWGGEGRYKIICAEGSFHGRTLGALAATGQPGKWSGFQPLPPGFTHVPFNDLDAFTAAVDERTAGILIEPMLGEYGVIPATPQFLKGIRELCNQRNLALVFDEVQTGMGRTGTWWCWQSYGVKPDIFTSAKALAGGFPMGACLAAEPFASTFAPGDHASTFGGGLVISAAALATIKFIEDNNLLEEAKRKEAIFREALSSIPHIKEVRGLGLMLAAVLDEARSADVTAAALQLGLLVNNVAVNALRITPPLVITDDEIARGAVLLRKAVVQVLC